VESGVFLRGKCVFHVWFDFLVYRTLEMIVLNSTYYFVLGDNSCKEWKAVFLDEENVFFTHELYQKMVKVSKEKWKFREIFCFWGVSCFLMCWNLFLYLWFVVFVFREWFKKTSGMLICSNKNFVNWKLEMCWFFRFGKLVVYSGGFVLVDYIYNIDTVYHQTWKTICLEWCPKCPTMKQLALVSSLLLITHVLMIENDILSSMLITKMWEYHFRPLKLEERNKSVVSLCCHKHK